MGIWQASCRKVASMSMLAAVVLTCVLFATGCSAGGSTSSGASTASSAIQSVSSSSTESSSASSSAASSKASAASSKDAVEISDVKLEQDAIGRYILTATVANNGDEALDVELIGKASLTKREKNKYDEEGEYTSVEKISDCDSVTPWVTGGSSIDVLGLKAGEKRELSVYPTSVGANLAESKCTIDKPELTLSKATPTSEASKLSDVPDFNGDLNVEITSFNGKKVSGTVTNNTGKYLTNVSLTFTKWDSSNLPVTGKPWRDNRPVGADLVTEDVRNLKPGAVGEFDVTLGDCDTVQLKNAFYDVDQAKS